MQRPATAMPLAHSRSSRSTRWRCKAMLLGLLLPLSVLASEVNDVQKLMQRGAYKDALALAEKGIAAKPSDANLRFLKGVLLAQMDRKQEAVGVFTALTQDFPQLAEPYNNLGVLLAGFGDFNRAREVLQRAVQVAPNYATAHENLGDLYARLSAQSYEKVAQLDGRNTKARAKLALARDLSNSAAAPGAPADAAPASSASTPGNAAAGSASGGAAKSGKPIVIDGDAASAPGLAATAMGPEQQAVLAAVQRWAGAWSARDMDAYFQSYASDFKPAGRATLDAWRAERQERIARRADIQVRVQSPAVTVQGDRATVRFVQLYASGNMKSRDVKELVLVRQGDKWLIQQERVSG